VAQAVAEGGRLTWNSSRPRPSTTTASIATRTSREATCPAKNAHGGQRRAPQPLEQPVVAHDRQADHQAHERAGHDGHAEHAGGEEGGEADLWPVRVELHGRVAVDGAEEQQEHHREQDGEERGRAVAPVQEQPVSGLAGREHQRVHAATRSASAWASSM